MTRATSTWTRTTGSAGRTRSRWSATRRPRSTRPAPRDAAAFDERAASLIGRLEAADAESPGRWWRQIPEDRRGIVTNHDALGYFIDEYGLRLVGSIFPNLDVSAGAEPS